MLCAADTVGLVKISIFQKSIHEPLGPSTFKKLTGLKSDFLVLPEYLFADASVKDQASGIEKSKQALDWLLKLSDSYKGIIIGGSVIIEEDGKLYNATPIVSDSKIVDFYRKRNLTQNETKHLTAGTEAGVFILGGFRFGVLICADVLEPKLIDELAEMGVKLVFAVMNSPYREETVEEKKARDEKLFCAPAAKHGLVIAKCCGVGTTFGRKIQGRSLVVTPTGISWRVSLGEEDSELLKTILVQAPSV
ncbi:MAG TPA: carbon-nitrogen hydrolase family protein [Leptospiraceae bacterium]|nr:carbon-nitrogen hydrolase family protein [Leptospiraceae bacterium]